MFSFVRVVVLLDGAVQLFCFYLLGSLALAKTEVRKYKRFEVGIIFCIVTKFILSYIVL